MKTGTHTHIFDSMCSSMYACVFVRKYGCVFCVRNNTRSTDFTITFSAAVHKKREKKCEEIISNAMRWPSMSDGVNDVDNDEDDDNDVNDADD